MFLQVNFIPKKKKNAAFSYSDSPLHFWKTWMWAWRKPRSAHSIPDWRKINSFNTSSIKRAINTQTKTRKTHRELIDVHLQEDHVLVVNILWKRLQDQRSQMILIDTFELMTKYSITSNTGAMALQGPHQDAVKSTTTSLSWLSLSCFSNSSYREKR